MKTPEQARQRIPAALSHGAVQRIRQVSNEIPQRQPVIFITPFLTKAETEAGKSGISMKILEDTSYIPPELFGRGK
ncbi:MAG TPA: hypothetical protein VIF10_18290 [Methylobacter sp.]